MPKAARRHPFRRPDRAAGRQAGAGGRRVPFGGAPLRPDERPDVGRAAPGLEGRAGHRGQSAQSRSRRSPCSISPAAPATWRSAWSRPAAPAPASPSATSMPRCSRSAASARAERGRDHRDFAKGNAEALPSPTAPSMRSPSPSASATCRASSARSPRPIACSRPAGISCAWNSPRSTCRGSTRSTTSIRSTSSRRVGRAVTGDAEAYRYLVESIRKFPQAEGFAQMIEAAGFRRVSFTPMTGGVVALHSGWRL